MEKEFENPPQFRLISDNQNLADVCRQARQQKAVALDTEFVRVSSYFPKLGLIQLYDGEQVSLIDPLPITDFTPFVELLADQNVLKILHSCSEDLVVFQQEFHQLPQPMMDTQILARFIGFPHSVGLAKLLLHYYDFEMDKGATRTNWLKRPLSPIQLDYAAGDVWYLLPLYHQMQQKLPAHWQQAVQEECQHALTKAEKTQHRDVNKAYLDVSNAWKLNPLELMRLKLLAKWRMEVAIERDLALTYVVKSESLWQLAKNNPHNTAEMLELGLSETEVRVRGKKMLQILAQVRRIAPSEFPARIQRISELPSYKQAMATLRKAVEPLLPTDLLPETVVSKRHFEDLIKWSWKKGKDPNNLPELLQGWRREIGLALLAKLDEYPVPEMKQE